MADEEQQPGGAATSTTEGTTTTISLDDLSMEQLDQLKQREEHRLNTLSIRYQQLRSVSARLSASQSAVHELPKKNTKDDGVPAVEAFVPLTESVYVPAIHDPDSPLLVDLGTGYYVEKSHQETMEFLDRKIRLVDANSDNITQVIQATRQNLDSIAMAVRGKLIEIQARRQGAMAMRQQQQQRGAGPAASS